MEHQTFWKPERQPKEKKQWPMGKKPKKEITEYKKGLLSHHLSNPSKADRAEFPIEVVKQAIERSKGICQQCKKVPCTSTHHVMGKGGRGGRGVLSNAFRACGKCHIEIEGSEELKQEIISSFRLQFGEYFWYDEQDWEEFNRKQSANDEIEQAKHLRNEQLEPIVELLTAATGRMLKAKELRLLDKLGVSDMVVFAKLMADVVGAGLVTTTKPEFGYGKFDD